MLMYYGKCQYNLSVKESSLHKLIALICSLLDVFIGLLLFIPVFGNGTGSPSAVSLLSLTRIQPWIKYLFFGLIIMVVLNGIFGAVISGMDNLPGADTESLPG